jgi:integrase
MGCLTEWLDSHPGEGTQKVRLAGVKKFLASTYGIELDSPREEFERLAESLVNEVKSGERDAFKTLLNFVVSMKGSPPTSVSSYSTSAKTFLEFSLDIEFSKKDLKGLQGAKPKGKRARTEEGELTHEVMKGIIAHCDVKGRALFLLLESSGIRIGEALQLTFADIDLSSTPPKVTVRGENAKEVDNYFSFMSVEALEAMREWLKVRDDYIVTATKRGSGLFQSGYGRGQKDAIDKRVFPFSDSVAEMMFNNAIKKLGLSKADRQTGRQAFRIHMLRKFFMSQMKLRIPVEIVEALCGHSAYLSEAYRRYSKTQIAEFYLEGEPILHVSVPKEFTEIKSILKTQTEENDRKINDLYQKLTDSNLIANKLRERIDDQEAKMAEREKVVETLRESYEELSEQLRVSIDELRAEMKAQKEIEEAKQNLKDMPQDRR